MSELPTELIAAFRATLEEVAEADVILHVRDAAHPDSAAQKADVETVLDGMTHDSALGPATLSADWRARTIEVLNKTDLLADPDALALRGDAVAVSAMTGSGLPALRDAIDNRLAGAMQTAEYRIDPADGARLAWLYQHGEIVSRHDGEDAISVAVRLLPADRARFEQPT